MIPSIVTAPRVRPLAQIALGDSDVAVGQATYDAAHYNVHPEATYSGLDADWYDISCDVFEAITFIGRERTTDVFDIGTATLTVSNESGWADYPSSGETVLTMRPGRQVRLGVVVDDTQPGYWLWHGWIDRTEPGYDPTLGDVVIVECVDAKGDAGRTEIGSVTTEVGVAEGVTDRLTRIVDLVEWAPHRRQFDTSRTPLIGTRLGGRAVDLFDEAAAGGGGAIFGDEDGFLTFRSSDWLGWPEGQDSDFRIGNTAGNLVCPNQWEVSFARADFSTRVLYARPGENSRFVEDTTNKARYGIETFRFEAATLNDNDLIPLAQRTLKARNFSEAPRIAACTLDAATPGAIELLVDASPFKPSLYTCTHTDAGRLRFNRTMYLTGIEHTITPAAWTARLALDDATPYLAGSDARYDSSNYNQDRYAKVV